MKSAIFVAVLLGLVTATPVEPIATDATAREQAAATLNEQLQASRPVADVSVIEARQNTGRTENEFTQGGCRATIFLFARGSTEVGNMGTLVGPQVSDGLKRALGSNNVATEGIDYAAALSTNFLPGGADPAGIREMQGLINDAANRCPDANIFVSGYSQGAALVHRAVESLSSTVRNRVTAAVTFGDTQNLQDRGRIPNYPTDRTLIICNIGDLVCSGTLTILAPHLDYTRRADEAVRFFVSRA